MENIKNPHHIEEMSIGEQLEINYKQKQRDQRISLMRSFVIKKQITEAYEILESIRFDYLNDTAFREKIVGAKRELERAMNDFLLDEQYHREHIEKVNNLSPKEYAESIDVSLNQIHSA